ncbi:MAG: hypothetical protein JWQ27_125 [Ferruginibacter sp.]|nr:hypothetical protein [Ferruginibacter sp.]
MKTLLLSFLMMFTISAFSQQAWTKFTQQPSVTWAAFTGAARHFTNPNLSLLLRQQFDKGKIRARFSGEKWDGGKYVTRTEVINRIEPEHTAEIYDSAGNRVATVRYADNPLFAESYFTAGTNDLVQIEEVLYVQAGKLKSHIASVAPMFSVRTMSGTDLGNSAAFSTAFNNIPLVPAPLRSKALAIGSTTTMISLDSFQQRNMIKQLYAQNLLEALWPALSARNVVVTTIDSSHRIPFNKLSYSLINPVIISVPRYDEYGNASAVTVAPQKLTAADFSAIAINQEWYYHAGKNLLFTEIPSIILYGKKWVDGKLSETAEPLVKIPMQ